MADTRLEEMAREWLSREDSESAVIIYQGGEGCELLGLTDSLVALLEQARREGSALGPCMRPHEGDCANPECVAYRAEAAEARVKELELRRRDAFNRYGVEIRYDDTEQLALQMEALRQENERLRAALDRTYP